MTKVPRAGMATALFVLCEGFFFSGPSQEEDGPTPPETDRSAHRDEQNIGEARREERRRGGGEEEKGGARREEAMDGK